MKKSFTLGAASGMSVLSLAVVLMAQTVGAQGADTTRGTRPEPATPSQACIEAMVTAEQEKLSNMDAMFAAHKTTLAEQIAALQDAADIVDDEARAEAIKQIREDMRTAMEAARPSGDEQSATREALKEACGGAGMFLMHGGPQMGEHRGKFKMMGKGPGLDMLAEKLGLTAEELKAELESGKTIPEIAEEHGVELPERPEGGEGGFRGFGHHGPRGPWGADKPTE